MAVFRVERNTGYTVMSNHHLRNKELTLKAKGLLSQMLSLPEDWDYTLAGLSYINRESIDAIRTAVWELEKAGYITRRQGRDEKGKMTAIEYTIYEQPQSPGSHSPGLEKVLLEANRRMMDLDDLIKGLYENFTLGRLPERQFNRLMTEYDTEQSDLEQRISELETATERISTKTVQIDRFVRLVKKYKDFDELTTPMLNDFIEKVVIHEAEDGRTKDRTQQVDIYFNFIGNFVLPLSEDEVEALQSEEARRAEEIAERKRKSSKKSTQKRNQKRAKIKAKAEVGDPEAMTEYKAILEKGRQSNRKRAEKMRELSMADPEYRAKMEEKERLALEREKKRQERATRKKKVALAELKEQAEKGNQEAIRELEERRAIARERSRKSAEKRKLRAENDPEYAKYLEERNAEYNRRHTARRKEQLEALKARAEAGDQEAQSQLAEHKQYQVRATVKSYRKMRDDALSGDPIAKERYEKTLARRREAYHTKKSEQTA